MALLCLAAACDALVLRSIKPNQFMFCFIDFSSLHQFHKIIQVDWFDFTLLLLEGLFAAVFSSGRSHWRCSAHNQPKRESSQPFPSFALLNSIQTPQRAANGSLIHHSISLPILKEQRAMNDWIECCRAALIN